MPGVGRPRGRGGYTPGALEDAISVWLYRHAPGGHSGTIAKAVGGHPNAVRAALVRMEKRGDVVRIGIYNATWQV